MTGDPLAGLNGYELAHLVTHLTAAGRIGDVHRLLALDRVTTEPVPDVPGWLDNLTRRRRTRTAERNAWDAAHLSTANATGYLADVALARGRADGLGLELRYALIEATVRERDRAIPGELVAAMVTAGLWVAEDGLSRAAQLPFPDRSTAMAALLPFLPRAERAVVLARELAAANAVRSAELRATSVRTLAPLVEGSRTEVLNRVLDAIEQIRWEETRADELVATAGLLSAEPAERAMRIAGRFRYPAYRADVFVTLLPVLSAADRERAEAEALRDIDEVRRAGSDRSDYFRSKTLDRCVTTLVKLAVRHDEPRRRVLLADAWQLSLAGRPTTDSRPPLEVIPHLPESVWQHELLHRYGQSARIRNRRRRVEAQIELVPLFPGIGATMIAERTWPDVRKLRWPPQRLAAISLLIPYLREPFLTEAAQCALIDLPTVGSSTQEVSKALTALTPHLPPELLGEALRAPWPTEDEDDRAIALTALLPHLPPVERPEVVKRIECIIESIRYKPNRATAWVNVVDRATEPWRTQLAARAVKSALRVAYRDDRRNALDGLAPYSRNARALRNAPTTARLLRGLPVSLSRVLTAAVPRLPRPDRTARSFAAAARNKEEPWRASLFSAMAEKVVGTPLEPRLVEEIRRFDDDFQRLIVLRRLVPHLDDATAVMPDVVDALTKVGEERSITEAVGELAASFPAASLPVVFGVVAEIVHEPSRAAAVAALAPHLPDDLRDAALADALSMGLTERVAVLGALAPRPPDRRREDAIAEILRESAQLSPVDRSRLLVPLLPWIPDAVRRDLIDEALRSARTPDAATSVLLTLAVHDEHALRRLAPGLGDEEVEDVRRLIAGLDLRVARVEIVGALAWHSDSVDLAVVDRALRAVLAEQANRAQLVEVIGWLIDELARLGGEAAVVEVARAIVDIGRWWR